MKNRKSDPLDSLLEESDDPSAIINAINKRFNIPKVEKKKVIPQRRLNENVETQTILSNEQLANECVSNWIFGQSPCLHEAPPDIAIELSNDFSIPENPKLNRGVDDGSFLGDPVLRVLRKRLRTLANNGI